MEDLGCEHGLQCGAVPQPPQAVVERPRGTKRQDGAKPTPLVLLTNHVPQELSAHFATCSACTGACGLSGFARSHGHLWLEHGTSCCALTSPRSAAHTQVWAGCQRSAPPCALQKSPWNQHVY